VPAGGDDAVIASVGVPLFPPPQPVRRVRVAPTCKNYHFYGTGTVVVDAIPAPWPGAPLGELQVASEIFTFGVPEPATLSPFALGLVGLGLRRRAIVP
jgi:hypothetical protein